MKMTKLVIRDSLVELMQAYPISKISVKMLCERADINRSTFYAHYKDQFDLLKQVQRDVVNGFAGQVFGRHFTLQAPLAVPQLVQILEYTKSNAALFKVLLSDNGDASFQNALAEMAQQKTLREIHEDKRLDERTGAYLEAFAVSGYVSILRKWVADDCVDEPRMLAELMIKLLFQGIVSAYPG